MQKNIAYIGGDSDMALSVSLLWLSYYAKKDRLHLHFSSICLL